MTRRFLETLIGAAVFAAIAVALVATLEVGRINPLREKQEVYVKFDDVKFLSRGNNVRIDGLDVGVVEDLELADDGGVLVKLVVEPEVVIRDRNRITVRSLTTLGGRYVEIDGGDPTRARVTSTEDRPLEGRAEADLFRAISTTFAESEPHIASAVANMADVMEKISGAQGTLGKLLAEDGFQQDYRSVSQRFEATTRQMRAMLAKVDEASGTLGKLLHEPRFRDAAGGLGERVTSIGGKVGAGAGVVGAVARDEDLARSIEAAREHLAAVVDSLTADDGVFAAGGRAGEIRANLERTMRNLERIREALDEGGGPLVAITQDPSVQRDLERTREHLAVFAARPPFGSLVRFTEEPEFIPSVARAFKNYGGTDEVSDIPPVTPTLMGFIRGYVGPPQRQRTLSSGAGGSVGD